MNEDLELTEQERLQIFYSFVEVWAYEVIAFIFVNNPLS